MSFASDDSPRIERVARRHFIFVLRTGPGGQNMVHRSLRLPVILSRSPIRFHIRRPPEPDCWISRRSVSGPGPFVFAQVTHGVGIPEICEQITRTWQEALFSK